MERRIHDDESTAGDPAPGVPSRIDDYAHPRPITTGPISTSVQLHPGDHIGRYVIRSRLGRGGMGVVYGAYDPLLGRRVAIKLVRHRETVDMVDVHVDERLRREAQALARLSHPNVVSLYDVGTCIHGDYLALELVPGINLDRWLRQHLHSWQEILEVFLAAGEGLTAAHNACLIHRDFKPTNVIVGPNGHVTVVDFGLARSAELDTTVSDPDSAPGSLLDSASRIAVGTTMGATMGTGDPLHPPPSALSTRLTGTNVIVGTNGYMAPEQVLGLSVGPRADQFSFCVALFEALYGLRPYPGRNVVETARAFTEGQRIEPENNRGVPVRLHQALVRGLSIDPSGRFPSMDALLDALRRTPSHRRIRLRWAAALLATATLSGGAGALIDYALRGPMPDRVELAAGETDGPNEPDEPDTAAPSVHARP